MQKQNPLLRVWELGKSQHSGLICAVISAFLGVLGGMLPYFAAAQMIVNLLEGNRDMSLYFKWLCIGMAGYLVRTLLYTLALSISHKATFSVLKTIRQKILAKLPKLPLGTVTDMSSGKMKQLIVDQVDGMETTLAHLFPELTANIAGPILIIVYLFILDWRMALLSLVSIPAGMVFLMTVMGSYSKDYEGAVGTTKEMNETIVEYDSPRRFCFLPWGKFVSRSIYYNRHFGFRYYGAIDGCYEFCGYACTSGNNGGIGG